MYKVIIIIDYKIRDDKLLYNINREAAKTLAKEKTSHSFTNLKISRTTKAKMIWRPFSKSSQNNQSRKELNQFKTMEK